MAFQVSPGIRVSEIDLTTSIPAVTSSVGGFAANFNWGPVETPITISNETELASRFGKPDTNTAAAFFSAASFLAYSGNLITIRANGEGLKNAVATANSASAAANNISLEGNTSGILIKNEDDFQFKNAAATFANTAFVCRYPGELGNSLKVEIVSDSNLFGDWKYKGAFNAAPGTSLYAASLGRANCKDELHVVVVDQDGLITGTRDTILEKYDAVSKASDAKNDDGTTNYYKDVINDNSRYIYVTGTLPIFTSNTAEPLGAAATLNWGIPIAGNTDPAFSYGEGDGNYSVSFKGGKNANSIDSEVVNAYSLFGNTEEIDVSLIFAGAGNGNVCQKIIDVAETRKDAVAFISPPLDKTREGSTAIATWRNNTLNKSSSYAVMDSGWKYVYDKYNDTYRWVPLNGDIAGLCARTDNERDPWFSPAGLQRGQIRNIVKLAFNPNQADRDTLYKAGVNPVVSFPGEGTILYGDKTLLSRPSAFDRINVRRLFIVLEKAIARAAKSSLFEFNDEFTRSQFVSLVDPFLRTVQGRRGITDYRVVCDDTNNTPDIIDRNEFVGDIYIKPARSINFIRLNFVAVRTGVAFEEVVGRF